MSGREVGSPVAQDLVGRGVRAERPAHRDDRKLPLLSSQHLNKDILGCWFQIQMQFYFETIGGKIVIFAWMFS